jgi:hypothetical protein
MARDQQLETIRQACIKANKEIVTTHLPTEKFNPYETERPIRLADVLLAIGDNNPKVNGIRANGGFMRIGRFQQRNTNYTLFWNLRTDDLTAQSNDTIEFLANLLDHA